MKPSIFINLLAVFVLFLSSLVVRAQDITVYAAASLTDVLHELSQEYQKKNPGVKIKSSLAGSSALAKQIENGAPAQIFISADKEWMDYLQTRDLITQETRVNLLSNELVLIAPVARDVKIALQKGADITKAIDGKICTGDPAYVPVGKYAKQALTFYEWWDSVEPKLVGTEDVRTALAFVQRGECSLGIVYKTDALMAKQVKIIATFPPQSHPPIIYPVALTKQATPEAKQFWTFLQSPTARDIFSRYGFTQPKP